MIARKVDNNQAEIVKTLRACGAFVFDSSSMGRGFPDLVCCHHGRWILVEIKSQRGTLTGEQAIFHKECGGKIEIVRSRNDAIDALNRAVK